MAVSQVYTLGLSKIEIGDIAEGGGMGTTLEQLGYTLQDSCSMTQENPQTTEFLAEEVDDPVISIDRRRQNNVQLFCYESRPYRLAEATRRRGYRHGRRSRMERAQHYARYREIGKDNPKTGSCFQHPAHEARSEDKRPVQP